MASLCLKDGVLFVGRHAKTASVQSFDLDGHPLETEFRFRDRGRGSSGANGLAVDADHRIWVADSPGRKVRCFSLFGREILTLGGGAADEADRPGCLGVPVDVCARGADEDLEILVASGGHRRHALQILHVESGRTLSLRSLGEPGAFFRGLRGVAVRGRFLYACEPDAGRVQVFRDAEHLFTFALEDSGARYEPVAVAPVPDGRLVLATRGARSAILLADAAGALVATLAPGGAGDGEVDEPAGIALDPGADDRSSRLAVIDRGGERVQVFNLEGRCYGSFADLSRVDG